MTQSQRWKNNLAQDQSALSIPDRLGVLSSTRIVAEQSKHVEIRNDYLAQLASQMINALKLTPTNPMEYERYHFHDSTERTVNWLLVLDAMNFCFWAEKNQPRWRVMYKDELLDGYWAEAASLTRAVEEGVPLWDAAYLSVISSEELAHIFRGVDEHVTIPLFEQRLHNVREVGRVLLEQYEGQFAKAIERVEGDAVTLALLLADDFSSFHDTALYQDGENGQEIRFFKRAQLCVSDLHSSFSGKSWGAFTNLDQLTAFADYKVPQVLRHFGVLEYAPALAEKIENQQILKPASEEEVELRAATVWACELLKRELNQQGHLITAAEIDQYLWLLGQNSAGMQPYHRVRTIYY